MCAKFTSLQHSLKSTRCISAYAKGSEEHARGQSPCLTHHALADTTRLIHGRPVNILDPVIFADQSRHAVLTMCQLAVQSHFHSVHLQEHTMQANSDEQAMHACTLQEVENWEWDDNIITSGLCLAAVLNWMYPPFLIISYEVGERHGSQLKEEVKQSPPVLSDFHTVVSRWHQL